MNTNSSHPTDRFSLRRFAQRLGSHARTALAVSALAALAVPSQALALTLPPPISLGTGSVTAVAQGYVVGSSNSRAYVWSAASGKIDLGALLPSSPYSAATGVNSQGEVVGGYYAPEYSSVTAFHWSQATGVVTIIGPTVNFSQWPLFINESGVVAGLDAQGNVFRWTRTGGVQSLGLAGAVAGINARGDIAINAVSQAYIVWGSGTPMTTLTSPGLSSPPPISIQNQGGVDIQVNGINDSGVVVGTYWDYRYMYDGYDISQGGHFTAVVHNSHAFKWTTSGGFTDLGNFGTWPLIGKPYPTYSSFAASATAINNSGTIVGYSYRTAGNSYVPFSYTGSTMTQLPKLNPGDDYALASGINNDGVVAGYSGGGQASVLWENGVPTNVTPSFAGPYSGSPLIKGSTVAGNGERAWTFALPRTDPLPTQTLAILGGFGNVGNIAANVEYYNPATGNWQPAYLANYAPYGHPVTHPWGNITGTNRWINYRTDGASDPRSPSDTSTFWYLYRVRFTVPADAVEAKMTFSLKADNRAQVAINGVSTGPEIVGQANGVNADAVFAQNLHSGENTITIRMGDEGGLNGFNFRIDLSVKSAQPLEIVTPPIVAAPVVTSASASGTYGTAFSYQISASNSPTSYGATSLPPGLSVSSTGLISGTPTQAGPFTVDLSATNTGGTGSGKLTLSIAKASATIALSGLSQSYSGTVKSASATTTPLNLNVTFNYVGARINVGAYDFVASISDPNYTGNTIGTLAITKATATVVVTPYGVTYNGQPHSATVTSITGVNGETGATVGAVTLNTTHTNAGTYADSWSFTGAANYNNIASTAVTNSIAKANATVVVTPYTKEYDGQSHSATVASITGVNGETGATVGSVTLNTTHTAVGIYSDTWSFTGAANYNNIGATPITNTIKDTTAPTITSLSTNAPTLWPPNHKMVAVTVNAFATDLVGVTSLKIISATSNEPDNGLGDGDTAGDIQITGALTLNLRAERSGNGDGRIYTIVVEARDLAGNVSLPRTVTVSVPKSQGK